MLAPTRTGLRRPVPWRLLHDMTTPPLPSLEARLARIERALAALSDEIVAIRTELRAPDATADAAPAASTSSATDARATDVPPRNRDASRPPRPRRIDLGTLDIDGQDVERLLGR